MTDRHEIAARVQRALAAPIQITYDEERDVYEARAALAIAFSAQHGNTKVSAEELEERIRQTWRATLQNETARQGLDAHEVARQFHEAYERLAPHFGYETREASRKPWEEVPTCNRWLMMAVVHYVLRRRLPVELPTGGSVRCDACEWEGVDIDLVPPNASCPECGSLFAVTARSAPHVGERSRQLVLRLLDVLDGVDLSEDLQEFVARSVREYEGVIRQASAELGDALRRAGEEPGENAGLGPSLLEMLKVEQVSP